MWLAQIANEYRLFPAPARQNVLFSANDHNCLTIGECYHVTDLIRLITLQGSQDGATLCGILCPISSGPAVANYHFDHGDKGC